MDIFDSEVLHFENFLEDFYDCDVIYERPLTGLRVQEGDAEMNGGWELEQVQVPAQRLHPVGQAVNVERFGTCQRTITSNIK